MIDGWQYKGSFVIKFGTGTDAEAGRFYGRIEHVASSQTALFDSLEELLGFLDHVLREVRVEFQQAETLADNLNQQP